MDILPGHSGTSVPLHAQVAVRIGEIRAMCHGWACLYLLFSMFWFVMVWRRFVVLLSRSPVYVYVCYAQS